MCAPQNRCVHAEPLDIDDLALLTPSTFSVGAFRAELRAKRSPAELKRILLGEQAVHRARAARAQHLQISNIASNQDADPHTPRSPMQDVGSKQAARHTWSAAELVKIQLGKEAAQRMRASTSVRTSGRSLRDSCDWARSSLRAEGSSMLLKHDVAAMKQDVLRYEESICCFDSPRSRGSSASSTQAKRLPRSHSRMP